MTLSPLTLGVLIMTIVVSPLTSSWLMIWLLMEINMTGMSMILMKEKTKEKTILFFMIQSLPSLAMLTTITMNWSSIGESMNPSYMAVILLAMVCKMGMFPIHSWILKLSKTVKWLNNLILMTIQKIIPLIIVMKNMMVSMKYSMALLSLIAMTIYMVKSSSSKMMLMASSMAHVSWMVITGVMIKTSSLIYLAVYSAIILPIISHFKKIKSNSLTNQENSMKKSQVSFKMNLMSLSGLPPLTGFFLKALVVFLIVLLSPPSKMIITLLMTATGAFYAYSQLMTKMLMSKMHMKKEKKEASMTKTKKVIAWNMLLPTAILIK